MSSSPPVPFDALLMWQSRPARLAIDGSGCDYSATSTSILEDFMGQARAKLNVAAFNGCLLVSAIFGWLAQSWAVFSIALVVTLVCGVASGEIRPSRGRR